MFTSVLSIGRKIGEYFEFGLVGQYSQKTTTPSMEFEALNSTYNPEVEAGGEIKAVVPQYDFSFSLRYLRELNNPGHLGSYSQNIFALSLSKRF